MYGHFVVVQAEGLPAYAQYHHPDDYGCISSEATFQDVLDAQRQRVEDVEIIVSRSSTKQKQTLSVASRFVSAGLLRKSSRIGLSRIPVDMLIAPRLPDGLRENSKGIDTIERSVRL